MPNLKGKVTSVGITGGGAKSYELQFNVTEISTSQPYTFIANAQAEDRVLFAMCNVLTAALNTSTTVKVTHEGNIASFVGIPGSAWDLVAPMK